MESKFKYSADPKIGYTKIEMIYIKPKKLVSEDIKVVLDKVKELPIPQFNRLAEFPVMSYAALFDGHTNKARELASALASIVDAENKPLFTIIDKDTTTLIKQNYMVSDETELSFVPVKDDEIVEGSLEDKKAEEEAAAEAAKKAEEEEAAKKAEEEAAAAEAAKKAEEEEAAKKAEEEEGSSEGSEEKKEEEAKSSKSKSGKGK